MRAVEWALLALLVFCAVAASMSRRLLNAVLIFICFGMTSSLLWAVLLAPEIAVAQALIGAGVVGVMFIRVLRRIDSMKRDPETEGGTGDA